MDDVILGRSSRKRICVSLFSIHFVKRSVIPDKTALRVMDEYIVHFLFPVSLGTALVKFWRIPLLALSLFAGNESK